MAVFSAFSSLLGLLFFVACSHHEALPSLPTQSMAPPLGELSDEVQPLAYRLQFALDPKQEAFQGHAEIDVQIHSSLRSFWMHGADLRIKKATLVTQDRQTFPLGYAQQTPDGVVLITLPKQIDPQSSTLSFEYEASYTKTLSGLYKVAEGRESYLFTQFEPLAARECFPGFDEPRFKTPFTLTLRIPEGDVAYANTPLVKEERLVPGSKTLSFSATQALPTYLIAFGVGPFDIVEAPALSANSVRSRSLPFRAIGKKGSAAQLQYALKHTPRILQILENYFQIPYPYEKLDIIAVPDFAAGAMENAGAITFREWLLLLDAKNPPVSQKRRFAEVMAHELAHQWFGNLVTMTWWNDLWLNEAFATWMGFRVVEQFDPGFHADVELLQESLDAMKSDSLVSARQIRQPITSYHDVHNAFDSITYSKGGAVLSMFEKYLGAENFRRGIQNHLKRFGQGTATAEDFIESIALEVKRDLRPVFFSYLTQAGVPLVKVDHSCNAGQSTLRVEQSRYLPLGSKGSPLGQWQIPFCFKYKASGKVHESCTLIEDRISSIEFKSETCPTWLMPNADAAGYYRFDLDAAAIDRLVKHSQKDLTIREQLATIDNLKASFSRGAISTSQLFRFLKPFAASTNRYVATEPLGSLRFAHEHLVPKKALPRFNRFVDDLYQPTLKKFKGKLSDDLGLYQKDLTEFFAFTRRDVLKRKELSHMADHYLRTFGSAKASSLRQDPEILSIALGVASENNPELFGTLSAKLPRASDPIQRNILLSGLARSSQLLDHVEELIKSNSLRRNELFHVMGASITPEVDMDTRWNWMKDHYEDLAKLLPKKQLGSLVSLAGHFCTAQKEQEVDQFFRDKVSAFPGGPRHLDQVLERISLCANLVSHQTPSSNDFWLSKAL